MRWDDAIQAVLARLRADSALLAALGGDRITRADSSAPQVPGVVYQVTSARRSENEETIFTRWDMRAATLEDLMAVEARLNANLDRQRPEMVEGLSMWPEFVDAWDVPETPAGTVHRTALFRFTVPRE